MPSRRAPFAAMQRRNSLMKEALEEEVKGTPSQGGLDPGSEAHGS